MITTAAADRIEALAIEVDSALPAERVIRVLEEVVEYRGAPGQIRVDNGPEFISSKLVQWCEYAYASRRKKMEIDHCPC
ncbi:transposase [Flammeovirgaceae bacterium 311]|nr:transposase [Flammeovirgaceae bacterium 311]